MKKYLIVAFLFPLLFSDAFAQKEKGEPKIELHREKKETPAADSIFAWRIKQKELNGFYIPKDINDCFTQLDVLMDADVKKKFLDLKDEEVDAKCHKTIGAWLSYKWELTEGSRLSWYFNQMGVPHPDYMISLILVSYHRKQKGVDLKIKDQVSFFREHWKKKQAELAKKMLEEKK